MPDESIYCPKEVSWLHFNHRVLQEAADTRLPLIERIKFLGIFSSNQDEYFRVRVANLMTIIETDKKTDQLFGHKPMKVLRQVQKIVMEQGKLFNEIYENILQDLRNEHIHIINEQQLDKKQELFVQDYFKREVQPHMMPIMLSQAPSFPELKDDTIYFGVVIQNKNATDQQFALIEIPSKQVSRFVRLPDRDNHQVIILLDDVIRSCLNKLFPTMTHHQIEAYTFKITRDADFDLDDDFSESYTQKINESLKQRLSGEPTRVVHDLNMPKSMVNYLVKELKLEETDTLIAGGRYHNFKDFMGFLNLGRTDLVHPPFNHMTHPELRRVKSYFSLISKKDILFYFPYHSFDSVIDFMREAAVDPNVKSIEITVYRLAKASRIINALVCAAKNGKKVEVTLELQARFDEQNNLKWANILNDEGVRVRFGVEGIKVHSKLCMIKRQEGDRLKTYALLSTGNFNESTAKLYTDHMLFTAREAITDEVERVFSFLSRPYDNVEFKKLLVSPLTLRGSLEKQIQREINNAKAGKKAWIWLKLNNIADVQMINKLQEASKAGVEIRMVVRSMCSIIPELEASKNIKIISIVDRLLEHSRIYAFANNGRNNVYLSSADLMTRNLDRRVEVAFPITAKRLKDQILKVFEFQWKDNVKARKVGEKGKNNIVNQGEEPFQSQVEIAKYIKSL
jgi:polyphosphate kinase